MLYMTYPSIVRQSFVLFHCFNLPGRCENEAGQNFPQIAKEMCESKTMQSLGYTWVTVENKFGLGDYLYAAPTMKCWTFQHLVYAGLIGAPHLILYVIGLPLLGAITLYSLKKKNLLKEDRTIFLLGLLYDGCK